MRNKLDSVTIFTLNRIIGIIKYKISKYNEYIDSPEYKGKIKVPRKIEDMSIRRQTLFSVIRDIETVIKYENDHTK